MIQNKAMRCDDCDEWVHVKILLFCFFVFYNITDVEYDNFVNSLVSDLWFCSDCLQSRNSTSDGFSTSTHFSSDGLSL